VQASTFLDSQTQIESDMKTIVSRFKQQEEEFKNRLKQLERDEDAIRRKRSHVYQAMTKASRQFDRDMSELTMRMLTIKRMEQLHNRGRPSHPEPP
jgi:predicted RNase H-like nuclease (RuvC/YqgF family)